jgi:hypothetical protein
LSFILNILDAILSAITKAIDFVADKFGKLFGRFRRKKKDKDVLEIPEKWRKKNPSGVKQWRPKENRKSEPKRTLKKDPPKRFQAGPRTVYHVSWLRPFKRYFAAVMFFLNFVMSQYSLASNQAPILALFFFGNAFVLLDYLWKTRRPDV